MSIIPNSEISARAAVISKKIKQLPLDQAHKIAAGEVVERPANIVKELLENSIDAGATQISLYIQDGGKDLIRIVDNGCGMSPEDARICFDKHATSKINSIDELETISTFGFRGEALASVAAIAQVTLITKEADALEAIKISVENSAIINEQPIAAPTGTDLAVANLFFNVPARKKFLKKRETEWRHIHQLFQAFCLDYPNIHFKLFADGKLMHNIPAAQNMFDRATCVLESTGTLIDISGERADLHLHISGIISDHQTMRFDRNGIFLFVNKRWIKNHELVRAMLKGYQNVIPNGRYPIGAIFITIDSKQVDVNIHPRKEEVKFMHPGIVENLVTMAVKDGLEKQLSRQIKREVRLQPSFEDRRPFEDDPSIQPVHFYRNDRSLRTNGEENSLIDAPFFISHNFSNAENESDSSVRPERAKGTNVRNPSHAQGEREENAMINLESANTFQVLQTNSEDSVYRRVDPNSEQPELGTILSQYNKTYILIEQETSLLFIDQHAAHERILYEQFRANFENAASVALLFPQIIEFAYRDLELLEPHLPFLHSQGIHAEIFGSNQLKIDAIPVHLKNASIEELLKEILSCMNEYKHMQADELAKIVHEKVHAQMACKAAVKAGDTLSQEQMRELIKNLYKTPNRFSCPHGRPTSWVLQLDELEKKFKRDYRSY